MPKWPKNAPKRKISSPVTKAILYYVCIILEQHMEVKTTRNENDQFQMELKFPKSGRKIMPVHECNRKSTDHFGSLPIRQLSLAIRYLLCLAIPLASHYTKRNMDAAITMWVLAWSTDVRCTCPLRKLLLNAIDIIINPPYVIFNHQVNFL